MKERVLAPKHAKLWLILALLCFMIAGFFHLALVGYGIMALLFFGLGVVILLYLYLPRAPKIVLTILLAVGVLIFVSAEIPVIRESAGDPDVDADYVIILGAGVNGETPSLSMLNRLETALNYLNAHPHAVAVVTGGQGEGESITEAEAMNRWLLSRGIQPERIIREDRATSTAENVLFSLNLIPDSDSAVIGVLSSDYHLYRAKKMAENLGYTFYGIPAPTTLPLLKINYYVREALGVVHFAIFGN